MKKQRLLTSVVGLVALVAAALLSPLTGWASVDPNSADLYHDGYYYGDSYFSWSSPGPWEGYDPGYEHDWKIQDYFYNSCTTTTNLPSGYDDCPSVGIADPPGWKIFSFGSFQAEQIQANTTYFGSWHFSGGSGEDAAFGLYAQNVFHDYCTGDFWWCMGGIGFSPEMITGRLFFGQWNYWTR